MDDDAVFVSTQKGVERRMASRNRPEPRLVPTREDADRQAIGRLTAALRDADPLVRESVSWALRALRENPQLRPIVSAVMGGAER